MPFRLHSKNIFLTYPQCATSLTNFVYRLNLFFGDNLEKGVACQESHIDGNKHLHAAICLKVAFSTKKVNVFDDLVLPKKHPNISGKFTGGALKAFQYVMKEGNYMALPSDEKFDLKEFCELAKGKKSTKASLMIREIQKGSTIDDLDDLFPEYMMMNVQKVVAYMSYLEVKKKRRDFAAAQLIKVNVSSAEGFLSPWNMLIASWLTKNLRQDRVHRQKQLWIQSPPEMGKTSLLMWLERTFKLSIYYWPKDEKWWDTYSDGAYDLIIIDEFHGQKSITELNQILSGDPISLSRRNMPYVMKRNNLPVIILSNFTPDQCFHKCTAQQLAPLNSRLEVIMCDGPIRIDHHPDAAHDLQEQFDAIADDSPINQEDLDFLSFIEENWRPLTPTEQAQRVEDEVFDLTDEDPVPTYDDGSTAIREQQRLADEHIRSVIDANIWQPTFDELNTSSLSRYNNGPKRTLAKTLPAKKPADFIRNYME